MKSLLRSLFLGDAADNPQLVLRNYQAFTMSGLGFDVPEHNVVWDFIQSFVRIHNHVPEISTLRSHFKHAKELEVLDALEVIVNIPMRTRGDFLIALEAKAGDRRQRQWSEALKEASIITTTGMEVQTGKWKRDKTILLGPVDSARYLVDKAHDIVAPTLGGRLSGEVTNDGEAMKAEYERVENDPDAGKGQLTFIQQMDAALGGAKRKELWIHSAFTGGLKSTFMLNWAYNQATAYKHDSVIFSLEMPYDQCRRIIYAIHSLHPKFRAIRTQLGIQQDPKADVGIEYAHIRDGVLPPNHKLFFFEYVIPDFNRKDVIKDPLWPCDYGKIHIEVSDPNKDDFTVPDLRSAAEIIYSKSPFATIFVDHVGLMAPRKWVSSTTERQNEIIRDLKKLALSFNRGMGIAVVALFQISREGFKAALKAKEKTGKALYNLTHLSYANEAERCVVTTCNIRTFSGIRPIARVGGGDLVWSSTGWRKVLQWFNNGVRRVWAVTTDRGSVLESTALHRVRVIEDGHLGWCAVHDLIPGRYVAGTFGGDCWPKQGPVLPPLDIQKYETDLGRKGEGELETPRFTTIELAYLLGAWDGDGKIHTGGVAWTGNRKEVDVRCALQAAFLKTFHHSLPCHESPSRPGSFDLVKWSQPIKRWFEQVAGPQAGAVPEVVLQSPRDVVCAYLRGLFDTDGWINCNGIVGINLKEACEPFLREIQMLLTALGIDSHLGFSASYSKQTCRTYGKVTLRVRTREGRSVFNDLIGFTDPDRSRRLTAFIQSGKQSQRRVDSQVYPVPDTALRVYRLVHPRGSRQTRYSRAFYNLPSRVRRTGTVPRGMLEQLVLVADQVGIRNDDTLFLRGLLDLHVMQIVSVDDTGRDESVMDLEVDGDHEYLTGPLLSHNSGDIITASWIDDELKDSNRVQFQCLKARDMRPFDPFIARVEWPCRRLLTCLEISMTPEQNAKMGAEIDKAGDQLDN